MPEVTGIKPEKTPADLKREEIAQELGRKHIFGGVWEWFANRPLSSNFQTEDDFSTKKIIQELARRQKQGAITSYMTNQPAFDKSGDLIEGMMAIYIQHPLQETSIIPPGK